MYIIHLVMVKAGNSPFPSQSSDSKKPTKHLGPLALPMRIDTATHQPAKAVSKAKPDIMDRKDKKSMLSDSRLNASRGMRTGAPIARTSSAC